jgi:hypothetical protein
VTVSDVAPTGWSECEVLAEAGPAVVSIKAVARHTTFGEHFLHAEGDGGLASARETCRNKLCETNNSMQMLRKGHNQKWQKFKNWV